MCAAFDGVNVVDIAMNVFRIVGVIHNSYLNRDALFLGFQVDNVIK